MLEITVPGTEVYDESTSLFGTVDDIVLELEHSLASLSKWEQIYEKPFLGREDKSAEEIFTYVQCMILTPEYDPEILHKLSNENIEQINTYINRKMTATWFSEAPGAPQTKDVITAELIYYWMTAFNIPFECDKWHLNRLFTLIRVCNSKQSKPKKMSRSEQIQQQRELNERRKAQYGTKG